MTSIRCASGHIIDVQRLLPHISTCPECGSTDAFDVILGKRVQWPAEIAAAKAAAQAAKASDVAPPAELAFAPAPAPEPAPGVAEAVEGPAPEPAPVEPAP